ncbi:MAG: D-aminoacyl-tRNA deacylase, partial [Desulfovibrio fairfieldensis]|nr:D-aminoacyl-tRNA deacylase [Desulfovibrio fairfieldensis]
YADCRKGRRPSFTDAGDPAWAAAMFERFARHVDEACHGSVSSGIFGAEMEVRLCNWGPVTIWLDSTRLFS